jgi:mono/diheme cytochrome c family protein
MRTKLGKLFQWIGTLLIAILGLGILAILALYVTTNQRVHKKYEVSFEPLEIPSDPQTIERGRYIVQYRGGCTECHGLNFAGQVFDEGLLVGRLVTANLTPGKGGVGATFRDEDWVRAIRYGVGPEGTSLIGMPSEYYNALSDNDLAAVIAYLRSLPPVDTEHPKIRLGPMFRWFVMTEPHALPASLIDFDKPRPPEPVPGVSVEYGQYLSNTCLFCHGENLAGGDQPGAGLNLTPGGDLATWSEEDFLKTLRTGVTPAGRKLDPVLMPWKSLGQMHEDDLKAIWLYLKNLPPVKNLPPTPTPQ